MRRQYRSLHWVGKQKQMQNVSCFMRSRRMNYFIYNPENPRKGILDIAEAVMNGIIEYHKGNCREAFEHLRLAVKRD